MLNSKISKQYNKEDFGQKPINTYLFCAYEIGKSKEILSLQKKIIFYGKICFETSQLYQLYQQIFSHPCMQGASP
jgi:hypothetical protein